MTRIDARVTFKVDTGRGIRFGRAANIRGVRAATIEAQSLLTDILSQPGQGEVYTRGTVTHRASRPGDAPAPDTGRLRQSLQTEVFETPAEVLGVLSANTEYAAPLELGTERIEPRPYISRIPRFYADRLRAVFAKFARG